MTSKAWYLGCEREQIADRVILIGDPARVPRLAEHLDDPQLLPVNRGLAMATGRFGGEQVTLAAFGMGAPIATIVLHELAALGASIFLRIGTAMCLPPVEMGSVVYAVKAISFEGTSRAYFADETLFEANPDLARNIAKASETAGIDSHSAVYASFDGFYRDMYPLDPETEIRVSENFRALQEQGVTAIDMETSALLAAGKSLNCKVSTICVASVDAIRRVKLPSDQMADSERNLAAIAFRAITQTELPRGRA